MNILEGDFPQNLCSLTLHKLRGKVIAGRGIEPLTFRVWTERSKPAELPRLDECSTYRAEGDVSVGTRNRTRSEALYRTGRSEGCQMIWGIESKTQGLRIEYNIKEYKN